MAIYSIINSITRLALLYMTQYLCVFLVAAVDLCDALLGAFSGGRGGEGLLHPAGSFPQTALDAEGLVQLVHLKAHTPSLNRCSTRTVVHSYARTLTFTHERESSALMK